MSAFMFRKRWKRKAGRTRNPPSKKRSTSSAEALDAQIYLDTKFSATRDHQIIDLTMSPSTSGTFNTLKLFKSLFRGKQLGVGKERTIKKGEMEAAKNALESITEAVFKDMKRKLLEEKKIDVPRTGVCSYPSL
ncbi:hypothetical protein L596_029139 [Steinernema carpocapsae]|uniref:Uncharacterized protein n=1 Tax=Steinernema carpocapsae TaxID=34508 RepID=A0A4U5LTR8_STECR|nr:hypothetical protein L596_029139 [Steinernema carpocapsae]